MGLNYSKAGISYKLFGYLSVVLFFFLQCSTTFYAQVPWEAHGALKVSENGHYLEHEDGTGFFWLGCTAWMLPRLSPQDVDRYLGDRKRKGFNVIQMVASNMGRVNYRGDYPFQPGERPWEEVNPKDAYWQHIDYIVESARQKGLFLAIFVWWGSGANDPNWEPGKNTRQHFVDPDTQNYQFGQMLGKRYNHHPHIIWVGAGEYHKPVAKMFPKSQSTLTESHLKRLTEVIRGIRETEPGNHLYTMHPISFLSSSEDFHQVPWVDFNMIQTHAIPEYIVPLTTADWQLVPPKPTFNSEGWYEGEHRLHAYWTGMERTDTTEYDDNWKQRYQAYWSVFAGGFGFTYGHRQLWRMEDRDGNPGILDPAALDAPGSSSLIHLKKLIESKPIQSRIYDPDLVSSGTTGQDGGLHPTLRIGTRDTDGSYAFIYCTNGSLVRVDLAKLTYDTVDAYWYNPRNGKWHYQGSDQGEQKPFEYEIKAGAQGSWVYFDPPGEPAEGNDWVLVLE